MPRVSPRPPAWSAVGIGLAPALLACGAVYLVTTTRLALPRSLRRELSTKDMLKPSSTVLNSVPRLSLHDARSKTVRPGQPFASTCEWGNGEIAGQDHE